VEWLGELGDREKAEFLGGARAVLFPIDWEEPFGLVQIEAMACGTPVIAFRRGSVPEIAVEGVTGFVADGVEGALEALRRLDGFDRARCRRHFLRRFSAQRMAEDYLRLYDRLLASAGRGAASAELLAPAGMASA
jgi:glycosyltransferase involved in cell wall biosynthesis